MKISIIYFFVFVMIDQLEFVVKILYVNSGEVKTLCNFIANEKCSIVSVISGKTYLVVTFLHSYLNGKLLLFFFSILFILIIASASMLDPQFFLYFFYIWFRYFGS